MSESDRRFGGYVGRARMTCRRCECGRRCARRVVVVLAASRGNILRVLRLSRRLPFLLQAGVYRHLDALRAAAVAAVVAASPIGGTSISLSKLASLLGSEDPSDVLRLCAQLPKQQPQQQQEQQQQQEPLLLLYRQEV